MVAIGGSGGIEVEFVQVLVGIEKVRLEYYSRKQRSGLLMAWLLVQRGHNSWEVGKERSFEVVAAEGSLVV